MIHEIDSNNYTYVQNKLNILINNLNNMDNEKLRKEIMMDKARIRFADESTSGFSITISSLKAELSTLVSWRNEINLQLDSIFKVDTSKSFEYNRKKIMNSAKSNYLTDHTIKAYLKNRISSIDFKRPLNEGTKESILNRREWTEERIYGSTPKKFESQVTERQSGLKR